MAMTTSVSELSVLVAGAVLESGQPGYDQEVAGFNAAVAHRADVVVGARSQEDVVQAVRFARARRWRVAVQSTGHGAHLPVEAGLLVTTRRIDPVRIDVAARGATVGAGARWGAVVAPAAPHGLAPITGSASSVGVVGFLLGGGIGPLVRSHGFGSDYLVGATLVTGTGDVVRAGADENPDVLWALRGGKPGLGIVTEVRLRLVELPALYAGALFFEEAHIEGALRAWIDWTAHGAPRVTTSVAIFRFPPRDELPPPLRGRRLLALRFAYPGDADGRRAAGRAATGNRAHLYRQAGRAAHRRRRAHLRRSRRPGARLGQRRVARARGSGLRVGSAAPRGRRHRRPVSGRRGPAPR